MNWLDINKKIRQAGQKIFTPLDLRRISETSEVAVRFFLHRYTKKGALVKLKNGLYVFSDNIPTEFEIANKLYSPSYISFEYALSFYHIIPETVYTVTSATTKPTREFIVMSTGYQYNRIKKSVFWGYEPKNINGALVLIASPEKAFVDYLYFVSLKKRTLNERLLIKSLDRNKITSYVEKFNRNSLMTLIKNIL
jgi:predicted transcriptional regulator of viral defense system